jgi:hypothetical protein
MLTALAARGGLKLENPIRSEPQAQACAGSSASAETTRESERVAGLLLACGGNSFPADP